MAFRTAGWFCSESLCSGSAASLALWQQSIVFGMGTDPEPDETIGSFYRESLVTPCNSRGPIAPDLLSSKPGVARILLETSKCFVGQLLKVRWQRSVTGPEVRGGVVIQRGVVGWNWARLLGRPACVGRAIGLR